MNCTNCGSQLPSGAAICPTCGAVTPYYVSDSAPVGPSAAPANPYGAPQQIPPTAYGSPPYQAPPQDPYASSPYAPYSPPQPTPPPLPQRRGPSIGVMIGIGILVVVLVVGGIIALVARGASSGSSPTGPTPGPQHTTTTNGTTNPYSPGTGTLVLNDPMKDNSRGYKWDEATIANAGTCGFTGGAYHIHAQQKGIICVPEASSLFLSNLAFEVKVTITQGDQAAIVVRLDQTAGKGYYFYIDTQGGYSLCRDDCQSHSLGQGSNNAINKGLNATNLLALVANGNTISAYVNGQFVTSANDNSNTKGQIGIESFSSSGAGDVVASDARVWSL